MTRPPCPLDGHLDRAAIDSSIRAGLWSAREVAERFQVGKADVVRHGRRCLAPLAREGSQGDPSHGSPERFSKPATRPARNDGGTT